MSVVDEHKHAHSAMVVDETTRDWDREINVDTSLSTMR